MNKNEKRTCPKCGTETSVASKFCPDCGTALSQICPKCHTSARTGASFCSVCGNRLGQTQVVNLDKLANAIKEKLVAIDIDGVKQKCSSVDWKCYMDGVMQLSKNKRVMAAAAAVFCLVMTGVVFTSAKDDEAQTVSQKIVEKRKQEENREELYDYSHNGSEYYTVANKPLYNEPDGRYLGTDFEKDEYFLPLQIKKLNSGTWLETEKGWMKFDDVKVKIVKLVKSTRYSPGQYVLFDSRNYYSGPSFLDRVETDKYTAGTVVAVTECVRDDYGTTWFCLDNGEWIVARKEGLVLPYQEFEQPIEYTLLDRQLSIVFSGTDWENRSSNPYPNESAVAASAFAVKNDNNKYVKIGENEWLTFVIDGKYILTENYIPSESGN